MTISYDFVSRIFNNLTTGNREEFLQHVSDDVKWTVMGTHPLAGKYQNKQDFLSHTTYRINKLLKEGLNYLTIKHIYVCDETAIIEIKSTSTANNGKPFNATYCWIAHYYDKKIVEVRVYVDSYLVAKLIEENEN